MWSRDICYKDKKNSKSYTYAYEGREDVMHIQKEFKLAIVHIKAGAHDVRILTHRHPSELGALLSDGRGIFIGTVSIGEST